MPNNETEPSSAKTVIVQYLRRGAGKHAWADLQGTTAPGHDAELVEVQTLDWEDSAEKVLYRPDGGLDGHFPASGGANYAETFPFNQAHQELN